MEARALSEMIHGFALDRRDNRVRKPDPSGSFSMKSLVRELKLLCTKKPYECLLEDEKLEKVNVFMWLLHLGGNNTTNYKSFPQICSKP